MAKFVALTMAYTTVVIACMLMANSHHHVDASITCAEITTLLTPCIPYAITGGNVPTVCCEGLKITDAASNTVEEERVECSCIQNGLAPISGINYDFVAALPDKCNHTAPYIVTPTTDCSKVP
ncbi:non-specific lipid-transfer protein 1-like [Corylus avellana]|uniref:non-specific lipid-transfer protein 1-like n=1 Tax=Corylus avellana TaxID=13451 RepID=UPI00286C9B14|nr:non-specific lipid-transfer protein 1-like [Corylus avellana]